MLIPTLYKKNSTFLQHVLIYNLDIFCNYLNCMLHNINMTSFDFPGQWTSYCDPGRPWKNRSWKWWHWWQCWRRRGRSTLKESAKFSFAIEQVRHICFDNLKYHFLFLLNSFLLLKRSLFCCWPKTNSLGWCKNCLLESSTRLEKWDNLEKVWAWSESR